MTVSHYSTADWRFGTSIDARHLNVHRPINHTGTKLHTPPTIKVYVFPLTTNNLQIIICIKQHTPHKSSAVSLNTHLKFIEAAVITGCAGDSGVDGIVQVVADMGTLVAVSRDDERGECGRIGLPLPHSEIIIRDMHRPSLRRSYKLTIVYLQGVGRGNSAHYSKKKPKKKTARHTT